MTPVAVHVAYGGAHLLHATTAEKWRALALAAFETYVPEPGVLTAHFGTPEPIAPLVHARVRARLQSAGCLGSLRIDFEDGYGVRTDDEEDAAAEAAARAAAAMLSLHSGEALALGIRPKSFAGPTRARAVRTLDRFFGALGRVPSGFVVTLPKVQTAHDVAVAVGTLATLEMRHATAPLGLELMAETPEFFAALTAGGLHSFAAAAEGRLRSVHFGAYDLLSGLGVPGHAQALDHPFCMPLRLSLALAAAPLEIPVYDGATLAMPVPPHRGEALSAAQRAENNDAVLGAMATHARSCEAALALGFAGSWDLHPAQLVPRYVATTAFYLRALPAVRTRLCAFLANAARATRAGQTFDDAASARGLQRFLVRGLDARVLDAADLAGLPVPADVLRLASFDELVARSA